MHSSATLETRCGPMRRADETPPHGGDGGQGRAPHAPVQGPGRQHHVGGRRRTGWLAQQAADLLGVGLLQARGGGQGRQEGHRLKGRGARAALARGVDGGPRLGGAGRALSPTFPCMRGPPVSCTLHRLSIGRQPSAAQGIEPARRAALLPALEATHVGAWTAADRPDGAAVLDAAVYVACQALQ